MSSVPARAVVPEEGRDQAAACDVAAARAPVEFRRPCDAASQGAEPHQRPADRAGGVRFDRYELAGAFGDIGTDLPLIVGLIAAARLDPASVLTIYGALQVLTGLRYGLPMPVQPLKAMAVIVIAQRIPGQVLFGGGLAIGLLVFALAAAGAIDAVARLVPKAVVRGVQFGLGLQLALLGLTSYVPADGPGGMCLPSRPSPSLSSSPAIAACRRRWP